MVNLKAPPHNEDAEQRVLGAILIDRNATSVASEIIKVNDFYNSINGIIFAAMLLLYEERKPIDILTLTRTLKKKKLFDKVDSTYLSELVNTVPTAANIEHYAQIIKEDAIKRALITLGGQIAE